MNIELQKPFVHVFELAVVSRESREMLGEIAKVQIE
jgi:hypothetical protein